MRNIPQGWTTAFLSDVARWSSGGTPSRKNPSFYSGNIPWIKTGELGAQYLRHAEEHISQDALNNSAAKVFAKGTVVLAMYGATIGKASILAFDASTNQACAAGFPDGVGSLFLYYFLLSQRDAFVDAGKGGAQPNISQGIVKDWPIHVPPEAEQTRIIDKLEELLSDLDAGVAELKAAQKKLAQYRQSLLKAAVEGRLTETWRAQHGNTSASEESGAQLLTRILRERRARWEAKQLAKFELQNKVPLKEWQAKYEEPIACDTKALPKLPLGWTWARAEQLCEFVTKGTTPPKGLDANTDKTVPFLRVTNLTSDGSLNLDDKVFVSEQTHRGFLARSVVYPNDILMNIVGPPLGQVSMVPSTFSEWNINQAIAIFRAVNGVSSRFISLCLLSVSAQAWLAAKAKTTAGQTNLTLEVCRDLPIALPPQSEQLEIALAVDTAFVSLVDQEGAIASALRQSAAQRKNILQAAFSGQLVPQDPNDEPASVLLARIRAERAAQETNGARSRLKKKAMA